jgi:hypothetical protein
MSEKWAWIWVLRKDGWMRRIPLALPLSSELMMNESFAIAIRNRMEECEPELPALSCSEIVNRRFVLQRVKETGEHALPWAEPHFYKEV